MYTYIDNFLDFIDFRDENTSLLISHALLSRDYLLNINVVWIVLKQSLVAGRLIFIF